VGPKRCDGDAVIFHDQQARQRIGGPNFVGALQQLNLGSRSFIEEPSDPFIRGVYHNYNLQEPEMLVSEQFGPLFSHVFAFPGYCPLSPLGVSKFAIQS
jgi:hypothetical protein